MAEDFGGYPPVMDEEEEQKKQYAGYPPVMPPAAPRPQVEQSSYSAPATLTDTTKPAPNPNDYVGAGASRLDLLRPAPQQKDYVPPEKHGLGKLGSFLASFQPQANQAVNVAPAQRAKHAYEAATKEHDTDFSNQLKITQEERAEGKEKSDAELHHAQAGQFDKVPVVVNGQTYYIPQKDADAILKTQQQGATSENVADTKAKSAEKIQGKSKSDVTEETNASKERIAANADKTKREVGMARIAAQKAKDPKAPPEVAKAHSTLEGSISRLNIMQENKEKALQGDQQAMLSLLANHIGMTMGLVPGARINRQIYQEAEDSAPWMQRVEAHFDKDGFLSGVVLTPGQMEQMNDLAVNRLREDRRNLMDTEAYYGFHGKNELEASAAKPAPPKVGDVVKGHEFLGGDPADKKNWKKAAEKK